MVNVLQEALQENVQRISFQEESAREKIIRLLSVPLLPDEQDKVYRALANFVRGTFSYQVSQKYPVISDEIFNLKRKTEIKQGNSTYLIDLPVIVSASLGKSGAKKFKMRTKGIITESPYALRPNMEENIREVDVECSAPEIIPDARAAFADSLGFCAELVASAYRDDLVSKILMRERLWGRKIKTPLDSEYRLVWAPSSWEAKVVERDPAIFMRYADRNFLIYQWDIPEERNLDAILREFSESL